MVRLMALDGVGVTSYAFPSCRWHTSGHSAILVLFVGGPRCRRASIQLYRYNQKNACNGLQYNTVASLKTCFPHAVAEPARKFNDQEFAPILVPSSDPEMNEHYEKGRFSPAWTPYVADAEKLAAVFRDDLRKPLSLIMARFIKSGNGECPDMDTDDYKEHVRRCNEVYSSKFTNLEKNCIASQYEAEYVVMHVSIE